MTQLVSSPASLCTSQDRRRTGSAVRVSFRAIRRLRIAPTVVRFEHCIFNPASKPSRRRDNLRPSSIGLALTRESNPEDVGVGVFDDLEIGDYDLVDLVAVEKCDLRGCYG